MTKDSLIEQYANNIAITLESVLTYSKTQPNPIEAIKGCIGYELENLVKDCEGAKWEV